MEKLRYKKKHNYERRRDKGKKFVKKISKVRHYTLEAMGNIFDQDDEMP
jgi:hypothetical protein